MFRKTILVASDTEEIDMSLETNSLHGRRFSDEFHGSFKNRVRLLLLTSTIVVALVFGLSFYFALVSNESAIASKVPELETVVSKLKNLLIINTVIFAVIIVASFYALSALITSRMFSALNKVQEGLFAISDGKLPIKETNIDHGPFSGMGSAFSEAVDYIRGKELKELTDLKEMLKLAPEPRSSKDLRTVLEEYITRKSAFLDTPPGGGTDKQGTAESDSIFMQPV